MVDKEKRKFLKSLGIGAGVIMFGGLLSACGEKKDSLYTKSKKILDKINSNELKDYFKKLDDFAFKSSSKKEDYNPELKGNIKYKINNLKKQNIINKKEEEILIELVDFYINKITSRFFPNG